MAEAGLSVEMLPARHGDGLWIEWGPATDRHLMLIDGGTRGSYEHLRQRFDARNEDDRVIDLLVVTHVDLDHIEAPIELLRTPPPGLRIDEIWFNDYRHLTPTDDGAPAPPRGTERGGIQGEFLGTLIEKRGLQWNTRFDKGPVVIPPRSPLPRIKLPGGLVLTLLSPTVKKLEQLIPAWDKAVAKADLTPGDRAQAELLLEERMGPIAPTRDRRFGIDGSSANGSSIAFIAEYEGERWLLSGDAHQDVLQESLKRYAKAAERPIRLDGFKIPHHGSVNNMSSKLLELIDCDRYLISTNGAYFKHPDKECIDLIVESARDPELVFNYRTEFTEGWDDRKGVTCRYVYDAKGNKPDAPDGEAEDGAEADAVPEGDAAGAAEPEPAEGPAAPPAPATELAVRVFHGSFDRADSPVMVGHYAATPLSGAEGYIDGRYGGRLSDRHMRGEYPGMIGRGRPLFVRAPRLAHPSSGVIVVALGEYGELTAPRLTETIRSSLVCHALDQADTVDREDEPLELEVSSVLIGATGDRGMSVRTSMRAIISGVLEANQSLLNAEREARCQYTRLDFWERRAPDAELALFALDDRGDQAGEEGDDSIGAGSLPPEVKADGKLHVSDGRLDHSVPSDRDARPWRRITVESVSRPTDDGGDSAYLDLKFGVDGRTAGLGVKPHRVERQRLRTKLDSFVNETEPGDSLYRMLFEMLLPNDLKSELRAAADIQLVVDPVLADIPWELLAARNPRRKTREHLALRAHFTRQLLIRPPDELPEQIDRADELRALVIGNPPAGAAWPSLQGAYDEAVAVTATLEQAGLLGLVHHHMYEPTGPARAEDLDGSAATIENALFENEYRIVHIAAHGAFDPKRPSESGVVIGPGTYLTAQFIGQVRPVPDLVFLNCCHLGQVAEGQDGANPASGDFARLGASLAEELIRSGVRAVVAAGWAVDDQAATAFATTFYHQLCQLGATFGEAVFSGRQAAFRAAPNSNTWGAYQCYGDTGLRLAPLNVASVPHAPATSRELLRRLEFLIDSVGSRVARRGDAGDGQDWIDQELAVLAQAARSWSDAKDSGRVAEQLGRAHSELRNFDLAIDWYTQALADPDGAATLRTLEQRANMRDRLAADLMRNPESNAADRKKAEKLAAEAADDIRLLQDLGVSAERSSLLGGHFKRQATVREGAERKGALEEAADNYRHAYDDDVAKRGREDADDYPLINYVQLEEIRSRLPRRSKSRVTADDSRQIKRAIRRTRPESEESYWEAVGRADGTLALAMIADNVDRRADTIVEHYVAAFERRSTARERSSALEHLADLAALHPDDTQRDAIVEIIRRLEEHLDAIS